MYEGLYNRIGKRVNSRLGQSDSDVCMVKIKFGKQ